MLSTETKDELATDRWNTGTIYTHTGGTGESNQGGDRQSRWRMNPQGQGEEIWNQRKGKYSKLGRCKAIKPKRDMTRLSSAHIHQVTRTYQPPVCTVYYDCVPLQSSTHFFVIHLIVKVHISAPSRQTKTKQRQTTKTSDNNIVRINVFAVPCLLPGGCCLEPLIAGAVWDCGSRCSFPSVGMPASLNWLSRTVLRRKRW